MTNNSRIRLLLSIFSIFAFSYSSLSALENKYIQITSDGQPVKSTRIYRFSSSDYFSIRDIASFYDATLEWYPVSGKVAMIKEGRKLEVFIKSTRVHLDSKKKRLSMPVEIQNNEVFVPLELVLTDFFSDFSKSKTSFDRESGTLSILSNPTIVIKKYFTRNNTTHIYFDMQERLDYLWTKDNSSFELYFPKGIVKEGHISIYNGIVDEISLSNDEGSATAKISVSTDTSKIEMTTLKKQNRLEVVLTSSYLKPNETSESVQDFDSLEGNDTATVIPTLAPASKKYSESKKIIIIDPGHGGADPGAVGPDGVCEKDITLSIAKKLKTLLDKDGSYETVLTRTDDVFIPLVERTNLANEKKADIFVSVHCNASLNKDATGFEIYFLSENASDSEAQATAMLENSVVKLEGKPSEKQMKLQELLWSMAVNEFINESSELSSFIAEEVADKEKIENRGVKQAGFFVLRGAGMPAILVESAFISNKKEESQLNKQKFQNEIAKVIYDGIKKYEERKSLINEKGSGA